MSFDRDFDVQSEMFTDDEFYEALEEIVENDATYGQLLLDYQRGGRSRLAGQALLAKINELLAQAAVAAESRIEMIREEKRSGEVA